MKPEVGVEFETTVDVAAPAERVWEVLADVTTWSRWTDSVSRSTVLTGEPIGIGSRVKVHQPRLAANTWTVTAWEPARRFTWESRRAGLHIVADHRIEDVQSGSRVTLSVKSNGALAPVVDLFMGSMTRRYVQMEAAGLKSASEGT
jgi:uncharacterized membrane protein